MEKILAKQNERKIPLDVYGLSLLRFLLISNFLSYQSLLTLPKVFHLIFMDITSFILI